MAAEDEDKTVDQTTEDQTEAEEEEIDLPGDEEPTGDPTEDELAALTDEERAALMEDDGEEEADAGAEGDPDPAAEAAAQPTEAAAPTEPPAPQDTTPKVDPEALKPLLAEAKEKKAKLFRDYEDGELTRDQYLAGVEEIDTAYAAQAAQAAMQSQAADTERQQWINTAKAYLKEVPGLVSPDHVDAFDAHVRAVTADPRSRGLSHRQMLEKAHRRYLADQPDVKAAIPPLPGKKADPTPATTGDGNKTTVQKKPEPPITLARVPSSVPSGVSDGRYGQLQQAIENAQTAEQIEKIMASMTAAEREAFASMDV